MKINLMPVLKQFTRKQNINRLLLERQIANSSRGKEANCFHATAIHASKLNLYSVVSMIISSAKKKFVPVCLIHISFPADERRKSEIGLVIRCYNEEGSLFETRVTKSRRQS